MADDDHYDGSFDLANQLQVIAILMLVVVLLWFEVRLTKIERKQAAERPVESRPQDAQSIIKSLMKDPELWPIANEEAQKQN